MERENQENFLSNYTAKGMDPTLRSRLKSTNTPERGPEITFDKMVERHPFIAGQVLIEYSEYLEHRCNAICLYKNDPRYKEHKFQNLARHIDKECAKCVKHMNYYNVQTDKAIAEEFGIRDIESPREQERKTSRLMERGDKILVRLPLTLQEKVIRQSSRESDVEKETESLATPWAQGASRGPRRNWFDDYKHTKGTTRRRTGRGKTKRNKTKTKRNKRKTKRKKRKARRKTKRKRRKSC
jgi:hypothetical protein